MQIINSWDNLFEDSSWFLLRESLLWLSFYVCMQASSSHIVHYQKYIFRGVYGFKHLNDIWMFDFSHQLDFSSNWFLSVDVNKLILFVNFHRYLLSRRFMKSDTNNSISSLTYLFPYYVILNWCLLSKIRFKFLWFDLDCIWILWNLFFLSHFNFLLFLNLRDRKRLGSHWYWDLRLWYFFHWPLFQLINIQRFYNQLLFLIFLLQKIVDSLK